MKQQQGVGAQDVRPMVGLDLTQFGRGVSASSNINHGTAGGFSSSSSRPAMAPMPLSMAPPPPLFMAAPSSSAAAAAAAPAAPAAPTPSIAANTHTPPHAPTPSPSPPPAPNPSIMPPPPPRAKPPHTTPTPTTPDPPSPTPTQPTTSHHPPTMHLHTHTPVPGAPDLKTAMAVTRHALLIQQMREMVQAILRLNIQDMQDIASSVAEDVKAYMDERQLGCSSHGAAPSQSLEMMQVMAIKAVLKVLEGTNFFDHEPDPSAPGSAAVLTLRHSIFGPGAGFSEPERTTALTFGSMDKVRAFHASCTRLLLRCLRPSNCLRLLRLGRALSLSTLEDAAQLYCLANLKLVLGGAGREEWVQLEVEDVAALLGNSNVQLSHELEVWEAASLWISYALHDRQQHVPRLLGSCLRLQDMNLLQLQQLRQTQLVTACPEAASLVSAAYTRQMVSSVHLSRATDAMDSSDRARSDGSLHSAHQHQHHHEQHMHEGGGGANLACSLLTISPDEEQASKKPRLGQAAIAAAVVGPEVAGRVDGQAGGSS